MPWPSINPFHRDDSKAEVSRTELIHSIICDIGSQLHTHRLESNAELIKGLTDAIINGGLADDRKYVMEKLIQALASLPERSRFSEIATGVFLKELWGNLQHPPISYMGDIFKYRTADGSNNNVMFPHIGKSGSFYARSVTPKHVSPAALPDPGTIFDALLARQGTPKQHPNKISSLLFALATIIIHDVFRTNDRDQNIVDSSSYLDLSPLYGSNQATQDTVRTFRDGKLKSDTFTEIRLLNQPPEAAVLLICFNRFHNYIADQLAAINEVDKFSIPSGISEASGETYAKALAKRDNDLFQTARLVTCGLYINVILNDYVRTILNLQRTDSSWTIDPRKGYEEILGSHGVQQATGNQVSVEFNLIYRWHSPLSARNERWMNDFLNKALHGAKPEELTPPEFQAGMQAWAARLPPVGERTFGGLSRKADGHFEDGDLVRILTEATEDVAGCFGARNVPIALKAIEILGIEQGRRWGMASLNELRRHFGMLPHKTFSEINSDPDVTAALEALYGDVENVELYPGVIVEEAKIPMTPGSGLCAGFTTTRAILSDAVALVRGDRFYTVDYSPDTLTAFGFKEASSDTSIAGGGVLYKLLMRAFPGWYHGTSIYAFYPFTAPKENKEIQQSLSYENYFDYSPPRLIAPIRIVTWNGVHSSLLNPKVYKVPWGVHMRHLSNYEFMLGGDNPRNTEQRHFVGRAIFSPEINIYGPEKTIEEFCHFYETVTGGLIRKHSHKLRNIYELDAVRDIANLSHTHFAACLFHIPLKSDHPDAIINDRQLYQMFSKIFSYIFLDYDAARSFKLRAEAVKASKELKEIVRKVCVAVKNQRFSFFGGQRSETKEEKLLPNHGTKLLQRLLATGKSLDEVTTIVLATGAGAVCPAAEGFSQVLDLFFSEPYSMHWPEIQKLAKEDSPKAFETLTKYVLEGLRLTTPAAGILRIVDDDNKMIVDGDLVHHVKRGEIILLDLAAASLDPEKYPNPVEIKLNRPETDYIHFGHGMHACLGRHIVVPTIVTQLRVFARLRNLRRAPGMQGQLREGRGGGVRAFLSENGDDWVPFPATMKMHFDDFDSLS
ncbi:heme peroxidase [Zopfia rhizophila CBS 207.26]|uniref:linoleate 8R-lipoxygenase n=1 Tax=Zopfia rhizophila CBS 207.26 TaxID=1314779 RepID=A0A6A6DK11_9PEZI|nr:heme peroxidase [Zopfia rhizophila CBS 207.26]